MTTYVWGGLLSNVFGVLGNWSPLGVPTLGDTAVFNSYNGTIVQAGTIGTLQLNGGNVTWSGPLVANNYNVNNTSILGLLGIWTLAGSPTNGNYLVVGSGAGGNGNLTVNAGGSILSTQPASTSAYALYVGSGTSPTATGVLTVTGTGSLVNTGPNGAAVGEAGTGTLNVQAGATVDLASSNSALIAALAVGRAGTGTVNVSGLLSSLDAAGFVYVGRAGNGALNVSNGATFIGGASAASPAGAAAIDIGDSTGSTAATPYYGGSGVGQVTSGGTLHSLGALSVGLDGTTGTLTVDGTGSVAEADGSIAIGAGVVRAGGKGTLTVQNGATVRSGTPSTGTAGIAIGSGMTGQTGTVTVTGAGSLLDANGYRISLGTGSTNLGSTTGGAGTLTISNGAHALAGANYGDTEAALAVGALAGGTGTLTITGAGSELIANGMAVIGGTDTGNGVVAGGTGTVNVTGGGLLQTGAMTVEAGSTLTVDASSTLTTPSITIDGGIANLATLTAATSVSFGTSGTLDVQAVIGVNTIGNFSIGDTIDLGNTLGATMSGSTVSTGTGSITVNPAPSGANYQMVSDGNGGTILTLTPQTIGVYRFFEQTNGTHFYTSSQSEAAALANPSSPYYRSDLTEETNGFGAYTQVPSDPNEVQVYRFFDTVHGTEFLTASSTEASGLMTPGSATYRPDLTYEPGSSFYEDGTQQPGDVPVYRFFDTQYGTHFYTGNQAEYNAITTPGTASYRADLTYEGVGFYAPAGNYTA